MKDSALDEELDEYLMRAAMGAWVTDEEDWLSHAHSLAAFAQLRALDEIDEAGLVSSDIVVCVDMSLLSAPPPYKLETIKCIPLKLWMKSKRVYGFQWVLCFLADSDPDELADIVDTWIDTFDE